MTSIAPRQRPYWTIARRDALAGWLFVAPQLAGIATFVVLPLVLVAWFSLHEWNVLADTFKFVGTRNYQQLLQDPNLPGVLGASALFSAFGASAGALLLSAAFGGGAGAGSGGATGAGACCPLPVVV